MNIGHALNQLGRVVTANSPHILTVVGATGVITTAVLAVRATPAAMREIDGYALREGPPAYVVTPQEKVKVAWKHYIPAAITGTISVACIVSANRIHTKRTAALVTAYSLTETAFREYKDKVVEQLGVNKEEKIRAAVAQDRVDANPVSSREVVYTGNGDVLCYETMTGRYFTSNIEAIRRAENELNKEILNNMGYVSQNDLFEKIGLQPTSYGEEVGWNLDHLVDIQFTSVLSEDGKPCLAIGYAFTPVREYNTFR